MPVPFCHANQDEQTLCLAFVSSLRLHPRRAPRLCWPVCQGKSVRLPCGSVRARRPTDIWEAGACRPMWASAPTKEHLVGRDPCVLPPTALHAACHCEAGAHTDCGNPRPPISGGLRAARPTEFYRKTVRRGRCPHRPGRRHFLFLPVGAGVPDGPNRFCTVPAAGPVRPATPFLRKTSAYGVRPPFLCLQEKLCNFSADFLFT